MKGGTMVLVMGIFWSIRELRECEGRTDIEPTEVAVIRSFLPQNASAVLDIPEETFRKAYSYVILSPIFQFFTNQDLKNLIGELEIWVAPEYLQKKFPYYLAGYDYEDRPIWITEAGKYRVREVVEKGMSEIILLEKYILQAALRIMKSMQEKDTADKEVREGIFIVDLDGLDIKEFVHVPTINLGQRLTKDYREILAEVVGTVLIINTNFAGEIGVNMVRPLLGKVLEKVEVYGTNRNKWIPVIRRMLPPHTIPKWYGGGDKFKPLQVYG